MEYKQELLQSLNHTAKKNEQKKKHVHHILAAGMLSCRMWHCLQAICNVMYAHQKVAQTHTF